ncbi:MAG: WXG100 family type VII secretion target [Microthrixaceae bacterium]
MAPSAGIGRLGADPEELERLARGMRTAAERLSVVGGGVAAGLRRAHWHGPDAEAFRARWHRRLGPDLRHAADSCRRAARELDRHAAEQRRAAGAASGAAARTLPGSARPPHLPRRIEVLGARADGSYLLAGAGLGATVTIEHLGRGRLRVTVADTRAAGVQGGAGRSVGVTTPSAGTVSGGSVTAGVRAETVGSRTWTIDEHHLPLLLAAAGLQQGWVPLPGPRPDRTERLVGVGVTASVVAGTANGPSVAATGSMSLLAGRADGPAGPSAVVQWTESGDLLLGRRLAAAVGMRAPAARAELTARLEVPTGRSAGARPVEVAIETTSGDERTVGRTWVDPRTAPRLAADLRRSAELLAAGDLGGAEQRLAGTAATAAMGTTVDRFRIDRSGLAVPVSGGTASATPAFQHLRLRRTDR